VGPVKIAAVVIVLLCLFSHAHFVRAETIYYAVSGGKNYEKETWHVGDLKNFNTKRPDNVFDLFTFERLADGTSKASREYSTPSGDWLFLLTYYYDHNRRLTKLKSEFRTFKGMDVVHDDEGMTRCVRSYSVTNTGKLRKMSEQITDMKSGREVKRTFYEPNVKHWMNLRDLPIQPKP